ncbi:MAG TPA: 5'-nucleotidase C-terminal domain-containing protein [Thermoanaerobaculia bacterium]|jgi:5'-nucleotidase
MKPVLAIILFLFVGCSSFRQEPVHVIVVGTTDVHGWFNGHVETPKGGGEGIAYGGLSILSSYVEALRANNPGRVLVVDSGDMFQGTLESNLFEGEPVIRGMNTIGYVGAAIGNHEFDFGPAGPDSVPRKPGDDPLGAVKRNASIARFPLLSANLIDKQTGKTPSWVRRSVTVMAAGAKIGIIGLSTPDTPNVTMEVNVLGLEFTDPVKATIETAKELRQQGADAIILIAHIGGRCADTSDEHSLESCDRQQHAMQLLEALPPGTVDAYFGGHTHARMRQFVGGVPAMQALPFSREFSTLDLYVDPRKNRIITERTTLRTHTMICPLVFQGTETCDPNERTGALVARTFEGRRIAPDARVVDLFDPYLRRVATKRNERLGITTAAAFSRAYLEESPLGNLVADALREGTKADFAVVNSGAIRAELRAGELLYSDIFAVSPFDNFPAVVQLSGAQIGELLRLTTNGERGVMQVSGLKYSYDAALDQQKPPQERNRLVTVTKASGEPLEPERFYTVAMPDFVAAGGDGTAPLMKTLDPEKIFVDQNRPMRELLIEVLKKREGTPLSPLVEGRITVMNAAKKG